MGQRFPSFFLGPPCPVVADAYELRATLFEAEGAASRGSCRPGTKEDGGGYLPSLKALASHELGNLAAYAEGLPKKVLVVLSYLGMSESMAAEGCDVLGSGWRGGSVCMVGAGSWVRVLVVPHGAETGGGGCA